MSVKDAEIPTSRNQQSGNDMNWTSVAGQPEAVKQREPHPQDVCVRVLN